MKFKIFTMFFFGFLFVNAQNQTSIQFSSLSQEFDFTKDSITLELKINHINDYASPSPIIFEIFTDLSDSKLIGLTKEKTIQKVLLPNQLAEKIFYKIPISKKQFENINSFTFKIRKIGVNSNFSISNDSHVVVLIQKPESKSTISLSHRGNDIINLDLSKSNELVLPFKIDAKGYMPTTEDELLVKLKIKNLKAYTDTISFKSNSKTTDHTFRVVKNTDVDMFKKLLKEIGDLDELELQIIGVEAKSKKEFKYDKETLNFFLKTSRGKGVGYNLFLGTNFDLKDKFEATSFYSEFEVFAPDLVWGNTGIRFGAYKNNSVSSLDEEARRETVYEITETTADSISYVSKKVQSTPSVNKENLGMYFEVLVKLIESGNFTGYVSAHIEAVQRSESYSFNKEDLLPINDTTISISSIANNSKLQYLLTPSDGYKRKYIDSYFAVAFPMHYYNAYDDLEFFLNPMIGAGNPGLEVVGGKNTELSVFGAFQASFIVASHKGLGVRIGSEIRHYFNYITKPIFNLNLSAKINLESIIGNNNIENDE